MGPGIFTIFGVHSHADRADIARVAVLFLGIIFLFIWHHKFALAAPGRDRTGYARDLVSIAAEIRGRFRTLPAAALIGAATTSSKLEQRIRCLVEQDEKPPGPAWGRRVMAALAAGGALALTLCVDPATSRWSSDDEVALRLSADPFPAG